MKRGSFVYLSFLLIIFLGMAPPLLFAQRINLEFDHITLKEGLSQSHVYCILQDRLGFLWFGTQDGLNRYDGYQFKIYKKSPEDTNTISANNMRTLVEDRWGRIWVGTDQGLNIFIPEKQTFVHQFQYTPETPASSQSLHQKNISNLYIYQNEYLWISTPEQTYVAKLHENLDSITFRTIRLAQIQEITEDAGGQIWAGTEQGLFRWNASHARFQAFPLSESEPYPVILSLLGDQKQNLWVGTTDGLMQVSEQERVQKVELPLDATASLGIFTLALDQEQNLWVGSNQGLFVKDQAGNWSHHQKDLQKTGSLNANLIFDIYPDHQGQVWIGTYIGGVNKYDPSQRMFHHFSQDNSSLSSNNIKGFCPADSNQFWVATYNGGIDIYDVNQDRILSGFRKENSNLPNNDVQTIYRDRQGNIWVGMLNQGLLKYLGGQNFKAYPVHNQIDAQAKKALLHPNVRVIYEDSQNKLWIGTKGGGLSLLDRDTDTFRHFLHDAKDSLSLSHNTIYALAEDSEGNLWVGTRGGGLNRFDYKTEKFYSYQYDERKSNSLSNDIIMAVFEDSRKQLWVGTYGGGLNQFDREQETFTRYDQDDGLFNDVAYGILEDESGYLWISTNKGLFQLSLDQDSVIANYDVFDGLQSNEFNGGAYLKSKTGHMLFGGINGFTNFDPARVNALKEIEAPSVVLTDFQIFNESVKISTEESAVLSKHITLTDTITLDYHQSIFSIEFVALNYKHPEKTRYRYRLLGFQDGKWNYTTTQRLVTYTNLYPATYVFEVEAINKNSDWSKAGRRVLVIQILPPFWLTWWFWTLCIIAFVGIIYMISRYRINQIQRRKKELEEEVQRQTAQIHQQKEEIQATLDNLKSTQTQLLEADKMASLGQLTAGIAHEINNPINFVYAGIGSLKTNIQDLIEVLENYEEVDAQNVEEKLKEIMELKEDMEFEEVLEEVNELTESIKRGAERTAEIVKGLRTFSRLDEDDIKMADMHENLDATLSILRNQYKNRVEIVKEYGHIPSIECYPGKLNQVFMNIISNAIQAIEGEGKIFIKTEQAGTSNQESADQAPLSSVLIRIRDTGKGMPEEIRKRVFEPFFTTKEVGEGTGLGLSIVHSIIEKHQGKIEVESEAGVGTEFIITLPIKQPNAVITD